MELTTKATIPFPPDFHERLVRIAEQKGMSLAQLVRGACEKVYGISSRNDRMQAVKQLASLDLPVSTVQAMKLESVETPEGIP